jgi:hypothetical protein
MIRTQLIPVELPEGRIIYAEVAAVGGEKEVAANTAKFETVAECISGIAKQLDAAIATANPDKATIEFSLQLSAQPGKLTAVLVQGSTSATLKVTLAWEQAKERK